MPGQQQENAFNSLSGFYKESLCSSVLGSTGIADATQAAVYENAQKKGETLQNSFTLYPSGMVVARLDPVENRLTYTKHYYSGTQRLSSKIGTTTNLGEFLSEWTLTSNTNELPVNPVALSQQQLRVAELGLNNVLSKLQINTTTEAGAEASPSIPSFLHAGNEPNAYYFHADHLGSTSAITDANGSLTQHVLYFAYGETFIDEHRNSTNSPYLYNGKEYDEETGRYYYGARYYDPRVSLWIGVDPLAGKYPTMSPYNYCNGNPINLIDPDGRSAGSPSTHTDENGNVVQVYNDGDLGIYKHQGNEQQTKEELKNNYSQNNTSGGGEHMGWTLYSNSFANDAGNPTGKIDYGSFAARDWINTSEKEVSTSTLRNGGSYARVQYALFAGNGDYYDFKSQNGKGVYSGSQIADNVYVSARDAGNYLAGSVAKITGQSKLDFMLTAGAFNMHGNSKGDLALNLNQYKQEALKIPITYGEAPRSNYFQRLGYEGIRTIYDFNSKNSNIWKD